MIEAGKCFCHVCGSVFTEAYYRSGAKATGVRLMHHKTRRDEFVIEPYDPAGGQITDKVELVEPPVGDCDGFPGGITVKFNNEKENIRLSRCCPACIANGGKNTELEYNYGKYPTFVVVMVGDRGAGKSTWIKAICYPKNFDGVNRVGYPYRLTPNSMDKRTGLAAATSLGSPGSSKFLRIEKDKQVVAGVWLLDMAGELYRDRTQLQWDLIKGRGQYPGADALVFFESAEDLVGNTGQAPAIKEFDAVDVYNNCDKEGVFQRMPEIPVAYVCTRADKLISGEYKLNKRRDMSKEAVVPLITEHTFDKDTNYHPGSLIPRIAKEHDIAKALQPVVLVGLAGDRRKGFMVQSCRDEKTPDGAVVDNRDECMNVMDPLLWVLNKLKIFPLTVNEGSNK